MTGVQLAILAAAIGCAIFIAVIVYILWDLNR
jgi:hypothetical protein